MKANPQKRKEFKNKQTFAHILVIHTKKKCFYFLSFENCRISEFVTDQSECLSLIELLLPFLGEGLSRTPDTEVNILNSIRNLLEKAQDQKKFYR